MKFIRNFLLIASLSLLPINVCSLVTASALSPAPTNIVATAGKTDACNGLSQVSGTGCGGGQDKIGNFIGGVVSIISYIAGVIAIIMIIISGIRYTTSGGDSAKVGAAKTALIYALIGVAVAGLAQILVHLVLSTAANA